MVRGFNLTIQLNFNQPLAAQYEAQLLVPSSDFLDLSKNNLGYQSDALLSQAMEAMPKRIKHLCLDENDLGNKSAKALSSMICACPPELNFLHLRHNKLGCIKDLSKVFQKLPDTMSMPSLSNNELYRLGGIELAAVFQAIPTKVNTLSLHENELGQLEARDLALAFSKIPDHIKELELNDNLLGNFSGADLAQVFQAIPSHVQVIELSNNHLGNKTPEELAIAFGGIPKTVTKCDFLDESFCYRSQQDLKNLLLAIPVHLHSLDLSRMLSGSSDENILKVLSGIPSHVESLVCMPIALDSFLNMEKIEDAVAFFQSIPTHVTNLDLSCLQINGKTPEELTLIFSVLPSTVKSLTLAYADSAADSSQMIAMLEACTHINSLDLSMNFFLSSFTDSLETKLSVVKAISKQVTSLCLSDCYMEKASVATITDIFKTLPSGLTSLDLTRFGLQNRSAAELLQIFQALPQQLTSLNLSDNGLDSLAINDLILLLNHLPSTLRLLTLGSSDRRTQRPLEEQALLRERIKDKSFILEGNGSEIEASRGALGQIPVTLQELVFSYLREEGEAKKRLKAEPPIQASFLLRILSHPLTLSTSGILLGIGALGLLLAALSLVTLGIGITAGVVAVIGVGGLTASFFSRRTLLDSELQEAAVPLLNTNG